MQKSRLIKGGGENVMGCICSYIRRRRDKKELDRRVRVLRAQRQQADALAYAAIEEVKEKQKSVPDMRAENMKALKEEVVVYSLTTKERIEILKRYDAIN